MKPKPLVRMRNNKVAEKSSNQLRKLAVNASGISLAGGRVSCILDPMAFNLRKGGKRRDEILNEAVVVGRKNV
jgi:hypothetical protein